MIHNRCNSMRLVRWVSVRRCGQGMSLIWRGMRRSHWRSIPISFHVDYNWKTPHRIEPYCSMFPIFGRHQPCKVCHNSTITLCAHWTWWSQTTKDVVSHPLAHDQAGRQTFLVQLHISVHPTGAHSTFMTCNGRCSRWLLATSDLKVIDKDENELPKSKSQAWCGDRSHAEHWVQGGE